MPDTPKISRTLRQRYVLALSIIAFLVVLSQGLIQYVLFDQEGDSRAINIAGRQRMLSQRITKCALLVDSANAEADRQKYQAELRDALALWVKSHQGLQFGDPDLGLTGHNSQKVSMMFADIEAPFQAIVRAANDFTTNTAREVARKESLSTILANQEIFLRGMDEIVFQYDAEAKNKVTVVRRLEIGILLVTFITLVLEAMLIFWPAERQIQNTFEEYLRSEAVLKRLFHMTPTPMLLVNIEDCKLVRANQAALSLLGISAEEVEEKKLTDFWDQEPKEDVAWNHLMRCDNAAGVELTLRLQSEYARVMAFTTRTYRSGAPHMLLGLVDITAKYIHSKELEQLAATDAMTGLLNRKAFLDNLGVAIVQAREGKQGFALAYIDLDNLKGVNDTFGHREGDWYICTVASLLRHSIHENNIVGRLGGDEFSIIFPQSSSDNVMLVIERIRQQAHALASSLEKAYKIGLSVGIVTVDKGEEIDLETLLNKADDAMYRDKHKRRMRA